MGGTGWRCIVSAEAQLGNVARMVCHLLECRVGSLFLGYPEPELRHPLLDTVSVTSYHYVGGYGLVDGLALFQDERVRALCDIAMQAGKVQSINQAHMCVAGAPIQSVAVAPLEHPAGLLGFLLLADPSAGAFSSGEYALLASYLPEITQRIEQDLGSSPGSSLASSITASKDISQEMAATSGQRSVQELQPISPKQELDYLKNEFISIISHELRTPLTAIKGYAGLLQAYGISEPGNEAAPGEMTPARQQQYLDIIMEQTNHLEVLIRDLLDASRIHAGRLTLRCRHVNLALLGQRVVQLMQHRVDQQQPGRYTLRCALAPELPLIWADPDRVQQVLTNLLENAIKYSPNGGLIEVLAYASDPLPAKETPTLHDIPPTQGSVVAAHPGDDEAPLADARPSPVDARLSPTDARLSQMMHITVRDHGIGISPEQQLHLFKPFSRLEHPAASEAPGAGLGLYITRKLIEAMGGNINLSSREGEGTSITCTLPVYLPAETLSPGRANEFSLHSSAHK